MDYCQASPDDFENTKVLAFQCLVLAEDSIGRNRAYREIKKAALHGRPHVGVKT